MITWMLHSSSILLGDRPLQVYLTMFLTSIVSSVCTVLISRLSYHPHEEVLFRSPLFHVLKFYKHYMIEDQTVVMLHSNHDHPNNQDFG